MRIGIIGGGPAGIISAFHAISNNIDVVLFEKNSKLGGIWNPLSGGAYDHVHMQNSKYTFYFTSDVYTGESNFLSLNEAHDYLCNFAQKNDLLSRVKFNSLVSSIYKKDNSWVVEYEKEGKLHIELFDNIIIATGELWAPRLPLIIGLDQFNGEISTARSYIRPDRFTGDKVLVVGGGVSGADISSDLVDYANHVSLSVKKLGLYLPRFFSKSYNDVMHSYLGRFLLDEMPYEQFLQILDDMIPDYMDIYRKSGFIPSKSNNNAVHVNEKIIPNLHSEKIKLRSQIEYISEDGLVVFSDGSKDTFDKIIFCTGYEMPDYSFINGFDRSRLYEHFFYADDPSLVVINPPVDTAGYGAAFPYFDIISRWVIKVFTGEISLPSLEVMSTWCDENMQSLHKKRFYDSWLETIRIGLNANIIPKPIENFDAYWNLICSIPKPEYLINIPDIPEHGLLDHIFDTKDAKIRILASLDNDHLVSLLQDGVISKSEYDGTMHVPKNKIIDPHLLYSQIYIK